MPILKSLEHSWLSFYMDRFILQTYLWNPSQSLCVTTPIHGQQRLRASACPKIASFCKLWKLKVALLYAVLWHTRSGFLCNTSRIMFFLFASQPMALHALTYLYIPTACHGCHTPQAWESSPLLRGCPKPEGRWRSGRAIRVLTGDVLRRCRKLRAQIEGLNS